MWFLLAGGLLLGVLLFAVLTRRPPPRDDAAPLGTRFAPHAALVLGALLLLVLMLVLAFS